jgi:hypothetical protein
MPTSLLLPPSFWFRLALQAPFVERIVSPSGTVELPESCALPPFGKLEGEETASLSRVSVGWNETGIGLLVEFSGKPKSFVASRANVRDFVDVCIDTRDTREIHRASRFCQRFTALIVREGRKSDLEVTLTPEAISRALADPPKADLSKAVRHAEIQNQGWRLGLFFPGSCLHGFAPETNRRLGLMVRVMDPQRGMEYLGVAQPGFAMLDDPSLWATLELIGGD